MEIRPILQRREHPVYSSDYSVNTNAIVKLYQDVSKWIENQLPGGIIYGNARLGKTKAIECIIAMLKNEYNISLPIFRMNMTFHKLNEKRFYEQFLDDVGHDLAKKGTSFEKKERLINFFVYSAKEAKSKTIILFIDEANYLEEKEYSWLMDIYNRLMLNHINLTTILVGTGEIITAKQYFIKNKLQQLVGRFMVEEHQFHGVKSPKDLQLCLASYDMMLKYPINSDWTYTRYFFPEGYKNGYRLCNDTEILFNCFDRLSQESGITKSLEIPMQYIILTINICLKTYGADGYAILQPTSKEWYKSVNDSGFIQAERTFSKLENDND